MILHLPCDITDPTGMASREYTAARDHYNAIRMFGNPWLPEDVTRYQAAQERLRMARGWWLSVAGW